MSINLSVDPGTIILLCNYAWLNEESHIYMTHKQIRVLVEWFVNSSKTYRNWMQKREKGLYYRKSSNPPPPAIASQIMCCMYFAHWQWRAGAAASPASQARPAFT